MLMEEVAKHGKIGIAAAHSGTVAYDSLEFMAFVLAHVSEPHEVSVRYYGAGSSTIRHGRTWLGRLSAWCFRAGDWDFRETRLVANASYVNTARMRSQ
jgi:hypothetical protein